uniref:Uncharacterized protein n=1 Tax=Cucumis melo TaxID=3656 RepID=A0A9I9EM96_CUCME
MAFLARRSDPCKRSTVHSLHLFCVGAVRMTSELQAFVQIKGDYDMITGTFYAFDFSIFGKHACLNEVSIFNSILKIYYKCQNF